MFHTFTGSAKRARQVNLSGRSSNPFAAVQSSASSHTPQSSAVQHAQQERKARQQERERLQASKVIQKAWRNHAIRQQRRQAQRAAWDELVQCDTIDPIKAVELVLQFARPKQDTIDTDKILRTCKILLNTSSRQALDDRRVASFGSSLLQLLDSPAAKLSVGQVGILVRTVEVIYKQYPNEAAAHSADVFRILLTLRRSDAQVSFETSMYSTLQAILQNSSSSRAYRGLIEALGHPWLREVLNLDLIAQSTDSELLSLAMQSYLKKAVPESSVASSWRLAHYVYLHRQANSHGQNANTTSTKKQQDAVHSAEVVAHLASLTMLMSNIAKGQKDSESEGDNTQLQPFVREQLATLVDQKAISDFLTHFETSSDSQPQSEYASTMASYILTLIQLFPRQSDEIRMWIYLGSAKIQVDGQLQELPAIRFFWQAVQSATTFKTISKDPKNAIPLLRAPRQAHITSESHRSTEQEWKTCLLFLELYTFVLKIMDDDEFASASEVMGSGYQSWTRNGALPMSEVRSLIIFLKNLAFTMYWHGAELTRDDKPEQYTGLRSYHHRTAQSTPEPTRSVNLDPLVIEGVQSSSISYMKGTVTGLLRMLYERDSRRRFAPEGFWLMPQVEMAGFISAVLEEQKHKDEQNEQEDQDEDEVDTMDIDEGESSSRDLQSLVGAQRTQYLWRMDQIRRQQQRALKRKRLEESLPRLNILENMPFFIPFNVRVEIFRQFVRTDQHVRRHGNLDPDVWRMSLTMPSARGDHATREQTIRSRSGRVRRDHVFEDAYEQFYSLGDGLKEPISITFVDQFDTPEAGIDGGGVTKEFLTSISEEAFKKGEYRLFKENSQHLLYPNPVLLEEEKVMLRQSGVPEGSSEWHAHIREITKQYEFIGRIVGKCLYEGILIDVHFAPFFLKKWALTGGQGSATNESGYRATINDLRGLDEELYSGLLKLKNYPGNAEDFSLDFTITDQISTAKDPLGPITVTRDLRPDGANVPVTNENKLVYISYVARYRLQTQPQQQTAAFLRGLSSMIQPSWLSMFNQLELQTLLGGDASEIDVKDLRRNTLYGGVYQIGDDGEEHPTVKLFWDVVEEFSDINRRKLLKYVTSTPRAPLLGFNQLRPMFSIRDSGSDQQRLPSTSTCVNLLKLPIYRKKEVLREKLLYAITSGAGFDLS